jgi:Ser/Thr protein kinase RdoA (MazF antagonist)
VSTPGDASGEVLEALEIDPDSWLGRGGEANVYALDASRVARVHHPGTAPRAVASRASLLAELAKSTSAVPFRIPDVLETVEVHGCIVTIESRLPGRFLAELLREARGSRRLALIHSYMDSANRIGDLVLAGSWYGDLAGESPIRTHSFREYLRLRAEANLAAAGPAFRGVDAAALAAALPEPTRPSLVHNDLFPANVLAEGDAVTAVLDFGTISIQGDRRQDPVTAAIFLEPAFSPTAIDADRRAAAEWLEANELADLHEPVRRWLAAYWSAARSAPRLVDWSLSVLEATPRGVSS